MVSESQGGLFSDDSSDISSSSGDSDSHLDSLVDHLINKLAVQKSSDGTEMTIKNRKDRAKADSDWDGAGPSSRHPHAYRPYAYPDERKDTATRPRSRLNHGSDTPSSKSSELTHFQPPFVRAPSRMPSTHSEVLGKQYDCRSSLRDGVSNHQLAAPLDKEGQNNSEDEYPCGDAGLVDRSIEADETNLEKILMEKCGWKIIKVKSDGACLFRSVAHQIFGDEEKHDIVRKQVVDYMLKNREHFSSYVTEDFERYIDRKRDATCYGNHMEIQAIAELYNRPVEIYHDSVEPINVFHADYSKDFPIRLSYHGRVHYNSVVDPFKPSFGHGLGMPNYQPNLTETDLIAQAIRESEVTQLEETMLQDKMSESEQLEIDRRIEAEVVRESYFDYLNQMKLSTRRTATSPNSQLSVAPLPSVTRTSSPPTTHLVDVASSSRNVRHGHSRSGQPHARSPLAIPSSSHQHYPLGMDEDSIVAMVLEQSRLEYIESLKKPRPSSPRESAEPQGSVEETSSAVTRSLSPSSKQRSSP